MKNRNLVAVKRSVWDKFEAQFTQDERDQLSGAIKRYVMSPPIVEVDLDAISFEISEKLVKLLMENASNLAVVVEEMPG